MKKMTNIMLTLMLAATVTACGSGGKQQTDAGDEKVDKMSQAESSDLPVSDEIYVFNFATNQPANHVVAEAYQGLVDELNEKGGGRIKATAFFSEQQGTEKETVDMVANNINDLLVAPGHSALSPYAPSLQIFDAPYVFDTTQQMLNFANGEELDFLWDQIAEETNIRVLGTYYFGSRHLTINDKEVMTPADLSGVKLRVIDAPISLAMGRALGAEPTPLAYSELYLALQQGIVDAQENPLSNILSAKFYEVQNTLVLTGHVKAAVAFVISEEKWQSLPTDIQEIVQTAVDHAVELGSELIAGNEEKQIEELKGYGMKVIEPDVAAFKEGAQVVIDEYSPNWIDGLYEMAQKTSKE